MELELDTRPETACLCVTLTGVILAVWLAAIKSDITLNGGEEDLAGKSLDNLFLLSCMWMPIRGGRE